MKKNSRLQNVIFESCRTLNEMEGMPFEEEPIVPEEGAPDMSMEGGEPPVGEEGEMGETGEVGEFTCDTVKSQIDASACFQDQTMGYSTRPWVLIAWAMLISSSQVLGGAVKPAWFRISML